MLARFVCLLCTVLLNCPVWAQEDTDPLVEAVIGLISDDDEDMRALAFEQVRTEAMGEAATKAFAAQLPNLSSAAQSGLVRALAIRGDQAAAPFVLDLLSKSEDGSVRVVAIEAIGKLGDAKEASLLMQLLSKSSKEEQAAAEQSLVELRGNEVASMLATEMKRSGSSVRVPVIRILVARRELETIPSIIEVATDDDLAVRQAAMSALGNIASPEHIAGMLQGVLKAEPGKEREAAEKCVMFVCQRSEEPDKRAAPVLVAMRGMSANQQQILLSTLGRIGGLDSLETIEAALVNSRTHSDGLRAICNWPDASIAPRLIELIQTDTHPGHATTLLRALIRVAPLSDERTDQQRLELLQSAMTMCTRDAERNLVLDRCRAVRTLDSLNFILGYVDDPVCEKQACLSIVELAHHRELRDTNKSEFHKALDLVIATSNDPVVIDRAQRYKQGKTWVRPRR